MRAALSLLLILAITLADAHPMGAPPGRMIDIGGRRLHLNCLGRGAPTVLIDIGLGAASLEWEGVMRRVAVNQKVCVFERAGYGWSEMGPYPRTSSRHADDLYLLQLAAELKPPFVLVGHSYGGYDMQLFARRYPYLVAGLVLVDASHPEQVERFAAPPYRLQIAPSSRAGIVQFGEQPKLHPGLSAAARAQAVFQHENWRPRRTISWELLGFRDSEAELRDEPPLPPMPLVVLTRGKRVWPPGEKGDALEKLWLTLQAELAAQSPLAAHLLAPSSGHQLHLEAPSVVGYAVGLATAAWRLRALAPDEPANGRIPHLPKMPEDPLVTLSDTLGLPATAPLASARGPHAR